jgi:hypothetical protein
MEHIIVGKAGGLEQIELEGKRLRRVLFIDVSERGWLGALKIASSSLRA